MKFDVDNWDTERRKHVYVSESIEMPQYFKIWDDIADHYDELRFRSMKIDIINKMMEKDVIKPYMDVMDVGCGPGTYSELFSERCKSVFCVDSSQKMLDRLIGKNLSNVSSLRAEWEKFDTEKKYDLVFSSLCPAIMDPKTLLKMELFSKGYCADVSFVIDGTINLRNKIWMALGRGPHLSYLYDIRFPYELLKKTGRNPTLDYFEEKKPYIVEKEKILGEELENLSYYMKIDEKIRSKVKQIVDENSVDGMVHFEGKNKLGLICWKVH